MSEASQRSAVVVPAITAASPRSPGASMPEPRTRSASSGTAPRRLGARSRRQHLGHEPPGAGQPGERRRAGALPARVRVDLGEHPARRRARGAGTGLGRRGGGEGGCLRGGPGELDADHVGGLPGVEPRGAERIGDLPAERGIRGGEEQARPAGEAHGPARRAAEDAHGPRLGAFGHEGRGQRPERRHQSLGEHDHAGAARDMGRVLGHRGRQRAWRHREADDVLMRELDLARAHDAHARGELDARQVLLVAARGRDGQRLVARPARQLDLEPARASITAIAVPADPAPITAARRSGGRPPSHSHWSITLGQMRSVTAAARAGDADSTFGKVSGLPMRIRTLRGRMRQPLRTVSVPITATGTTGAPVSSASRPTPRFGRPSAPGRVRVPSGNMSTHSPRSSSALAVASMSWSPPPRRTGKAPRALRNQATTGWLKSSCLAT